MKVETYLNFPGNCQAALQFYESALGARVKFLQLFRGSPMESQVPPEMGDKVLHAVLEIGDSTLMASDGMSQGSPGGMAGFSISLNVDTPEDAARLFSALLPGGRVVLPLQETFWARSFGMLVDQFGLPWMINCEKPMEAAQAGSKGSASPETGDSSQ